jgi:hypothetical protein
MNGEQTEWKFEGIRLPYFKYCSGIWLEKMRGKTGKEKIT